MKVVAPASSRSLLVLSVDLPLALVKARKRAARDAPDSEGSSAREPPGIVRETVEEAVFGEVTTVRPEGSLVTETAPTVRG